MKELADGTKAREAISPYSLRTFVPAQAAWEGEGGRPRGSAGTSGACGHLQHPGDSGGLAAGTPGAGRGGWQRAGGPEAVALGTVPLPSDRFRLEKRAEPPAGRERVEPGVPRARGRCFLLAGCRSGCSAWVPSAGARRPRARFVPPLPAAPRRRGRGWRPPKGARRTPGPAGCKAERGAGHGPLPAHLGGSGRPELPYKEGLGAVIRVGVLLSSTL